MNEERLKKLWEKDKALRKALDENMGEIEKVIKNSGTSRPLSKGKKSLKEQALSDFLKYNTRIKVA